MRLLGLFGLGLILFLAGGDGRAEEYDLMAMRGDDRIWVGSFTWTEESISESGPSFMPETYKPGNPGFPPKPVAGMAASVKYLEWKNICTPPTISAGLILDMGIRDGFRLVTPFLSSSPDSGQDYLELLIREFTGG
ncbi:MAG: hypothetical protein FWG74_06115 [Planctomycetes bacterium]|nr:hypothetical protein [Planctomycetota bacterium]